jgi:hypothetical protein
MSQLNATVFHVHTFFVCLVLVAMGLPALLEPGVFLLHSRAGLWVSCSLAVFWFCRLIAQWTVYRPSWWHGQPLESAMHWVFTVVWLFLTLLFAACSARQFGWL